MKLAGVILIVGATVGTVAWFVITRSFKLETLRATALIWLMMLLVGFALIDRE